MQRRTFAALAFSAAALAGCQTPPSPDPTGRADTDMVRVLTTYLNSGAKPVSTLTVAEARAQPTPQDAARQVAEQMGKSPMRLARVYDIQVQGDGVMIPARVYDPQASRGPAPVIVYYHGGGWVTGTLDTYDASDRALATGTGAIVVSVGYRLGPDHRFPTAHNDADLAYQWVTQNAAGFGGDPRRIAVAGESAGGNMAIDVSIWARDNGVKPPVHQLLVYPVAGTDLYTPSYKETVNAVPLNRAAIQWYVKNYTNGPQDLKDPRLNVVGAANLKGLPPTTIILAEIDPLRSEGQALAEKLQAAGVSVAQQTYPGVTHEFFGMGQAVTQARLAEDLAISRLNTAFSQPGGTTQGMRVRSDPATAPMMDTAMPSSGIAR